MSSNHIPILTENMKRSQYQSMQKMIDRMRPEDWNRYGNLLTCCKIFVISPIKLWWLIMEICLIVEIAIFSYQFSQESLYAFLVATVSGTIAFLSFVKTALMDPGVLKRPEFEQAVENAKAVAEQIRHGVSEIYLPVPLKGELVKYRWCAICCHYRPPKCTHCTTCNSCILKYDHHCPVFGGCVGANNIRSFFVMTASTPIFWIVVLVTSVYYLTADTETSEKPSKLLFRSLSLIWIFVTLGMVITIPLLVTWICGCSDNIYCDIESRGSEVKQAKSCSTDQINFTISRIKNSRLNQDDNHNYNQNIYIASHKRTKKIDLESVSFGKY